MAVEEHPGAGPHPAEGRDQALRRLAREMESIAAIGRIVSSTPKIEEVYERFAAEARRLISFDRVTINLNDLPRRLIFQAYVAGLYVPQRRAGASMPLPHSVNEKMLASRQGFLLRLKSRKEIATTFPNLLAPFQAGIRSILAVPLIARDQVIGGLNFQSKKIGIYHRRDLKLAESIAAQVAGAISNARLFLGQQQAERALRRSQEELEERIEERTRELTRSNQALHAEVAERRRAEITLQRRERELKVKSHHLEEMNAALNVLIKQREKDALEVEEAVVSNLKELVFPYLEKMEKGRMDTLQAGYLNLIESNLRGIISPFLRNLASKHLDLTPKEVRVAHFIREGKATKEISALLNVSTKAIDFHRSNIRKKLGLKNKKINLESYLASFA